MGDDPRFQFIGPSVKPGEIIVLDLATGLASRALDVPSDCGHDQHRPTGPEIDGCPEVIVRECAMCHAPLWWNVDRWRLV